MSPLLCFLLVINGITLFTFGLDKWLAVNRKSRIAERTLLLLAFFGGTMGALSGILLFRHKIAKGSFLWKFAVVFAIQVIILYLLLPYFFSPDQVSDR